MYLAKICDKIDLIRTPSMFTFSYSCVYYNNRQRETKLREVATNLLVF